MFRNAAELEVLGTELPSEFDASKELQATSKSSLLPEALSADLAANLGHASRSAMFAATCRLHGTGRQKDRGRGYGYPGALDVGAVDAQVLYGSGSVVCITRLAAIEGTVVNTLRARATRDSEVVRIGHPAGVMDSKVMSRRENGETSIQSGSFARTARRIMEGFAFLHSRRGGIHVT